MSATPLGWTALHATALVVGESGVLLRGPSGAGKIERRFEGLIAVAAEPAAVIRLVVDLAGRGETPPRLPDDDELSAEILGVRLPRVPLDPAHGPADHARVVLESLARRVEADHGGLTTGMSL